MDNVTVTQLTPFVVLAITVGSAIFLKIVDIVWQAVTGSKNKTDAKIENVEKEIYTEIDRVEGSVKVALDKINNKLSEIQSILDKSSALERPARVCREYVDSKYVKLLEKQTDIMNKQAVILEKILENSNAKHS